MLRVLLLSNENSRSAGDLRHEVEALLSQAEGIQRVSLQGDNQAEHFAKVIREHAQSFDHVVILGGDGSVNAALPGLLATQKPFSVWPLGTSNNLARHFGLKGGSEELLSTLREGVPVTLDVGMANCQPFLVVVGLGLSTKVNMLIPKHLKKRFGPFGYVFFAIKVLLNLRPFTVRILADGETFQRKVVQVTICNGKFYGAGAPVSKTATLSDGKFDLIASQRQNLWRSILNVPAYMRGDFERVKEVLALKASTFEVHSQKKRPVDLDGDVKIETPIRIEMNPRKVQIVIPRSI